MILKVKFICIGKTGKDFLIAGEQEYLKRLTHYITIERVEISDLKNAKKLTIDQIKELEGKEILSKVSSGENIILLDENGKQFSSVEFSNFIQQKFTFEHFFKYFLTTENSLQLFFTNFFELDPDPHYRIGFEKLLDPDQQKSG